MWCSRRNFGPAILVSLLLTATAHAEGYILGAGVEGDSEDGRAYTALAIFR